MQLGMLRIGVNRAALQPPRPACLKPFFGRLRNRDAGRVRRMGPLGYLELRPGYESVGLLLFLEGLQPALPCLVNLIDNPGFPRVALRGFPCALAYGHWNLDAIASCCDKIR
jgi:hypothetical protein